MSTTISFVAEQSFSKAIDSVVSKTGLYQSKSEFVREAVREKLVRVLSLERDLIAVRESKKRLQQKAAFKGELSDSERDGLARAYLKSLKA
ncbi:MAG: ribbon-helix-helix domain-containing protein [Candidatus Diapherotrites archaeon]